MVRGARSVGTPCSGDLSYLPFGNFKNKASCHSITVSRDGYVCGMIKRLVKVAMSTLRGRPTAETRSSHTLSAAGLPRALSPPFPMMGTPRPTLPLPHSRLPSLIGATRISPRTSTHSCQPLLLRLRFPPWNHHSRYVVQCSK